MVALTIRQRFTIVFLILAMGLAGCGVMDGPRATATPSLTPGPTATPPPTWTPTPTPTATPIPKAELEILWPESVSPLTSVSVEVAFIPPPGIDVSAELSATLIDSQDHVYATLALTERVGDRYRSPEVLELPLTPGPGYWWLVVHVDSEVPWTGNSALYFDIEPVEYRVLTPTLPSTVSLQVPVAFEEIVAAGDPRAGGRVWRYGDGEVSLWWAPGPTQALSLSNAVVALEASYGANPQGGAVPTPTEAVPIVWQDRPGYEFPETWPDPDGGPGRAWVIQGEDFWLYVLRVRSLGGDRIPVLHLEIVQTFEFVDAAESR